MSTPRAQLTEVYPMLPFEPVSGTGLYLRDDAGREVLDLYAGHAVAALGYGHPRLVHALAQQAEQLYFQSNAVNLRIRDAAADRLAAFAPEGLDRVFFVNSGAEANENALRIALRATGRKKIVAIERSFHGRSAAAAAVTWGAKDRWYGFPRTPMDVDFAPRNDVAALEAAIDADTAALIIEPVQGLAGAFDFSHEFMTAAREACTRAGALLILDEVQTGVGRLGEPFGADLYDVRPDLLTTAKGLGGGFPCGAVVMTQDLAVDLKPGDLGTTFGGGPLACAVIEAVIDTIESDNVLDNVRAMSALVRETCTHGPITAIQGAGLLLGLKTEVKASAVRNALLERDILVGTSADPHIMRLLPPLILNENHVARLSSALKELNDESLQ
ncbi:MAG: aminotransferase class III-fold pyridoxal phosphate-dependent enzyme [Gammaproteobacteria bacterium]|nr:aminotransferase class III-fold pyridoxal phosphate-dependent enzyme [Gammaproteobacteria bacterium]MDH3505511.1 aminotransferase class III-fold pyridoxal phosphate-dependent enzyme [Gammaproteobacteria bacterium]